LGRSGFFYQNVYQDFDSKQVYTSLVNSYLTIGAELGIGVLTCCLFALFFALGLGSRWKDQPDNVCAAKIVILVWAIVNVFSTLYRSWPLALLPIAAAGYNILKDRQTWSIRLIWSSLAAAATVCSLYLLSIWVGRHAEIKVTERNNRLIFECPQIDNGSRREICIIPDENVLGRSPGKEIRRLLIQGRVQRAISLSPQGSTFKGEFGHKMMFGASASDRRNFANNHDDVVYIIHPTRSPPATPETYHFLHLFVQLPEIDEAAVNEAWRQWTRKYNGAIRETPNSGIDIRNQWPAIAPDIQ
jgi:hypothetical protein